MWVQMDRLQWTLLRHRHVVPVDRTPQAVTVADMLTPSVKQT